MSSIPIAYQSCRPLDPSNMPFWAQFPNVQSPCDQWTCIRASRAFYSRKRRLLTGLVLLPHERSPAKTGFGRSSDPRSWIERGAKISGLTEHGSGGLGAATTGEGRRSSVQISLPKGSAPHLRLELLRPRGRNWGRGGGNHERRCQTREGAKAEELAAYPRCWEVTRKEGGQGTTARSQYKLDQDNGGIKSSSGRMKDCVGRKELSSEHCPRENRDGGSGVRRSRLGYREHGMRAKAPPRLENDGVRLDSR
jgi:hypothetical protein